MRPLVFIWHSIWCRKRDRRNRSDEPKFWLVAFAWQTTDQQSPYNDCVDAAGLFMSDDELVAGKSEAANSMILANEWQVYRKSWRFFLLFTNKRWLALAKQYLVVFAPKCIRPATYLTIGLTIVLFDAVLAYQQLKSTNLDLSKLCVFAGFILFSMFVGMPLMFFGLVKWLLTITVFCRFWMLNDLSVTDKDVLVQRRDQAFNDISKRTGYLTKFGLTSALLSALPIFICFLFFVLKLATMSAVMGVMAITLPPGMPTALDAMIAFMFCAVITFSLVAIPVAAVSELPPQRAAIWAALVTIRYFPQSALIAIFVTAIGSLISAPLALLEVGSVNVLIAIFVSQLWEGISSVFIIPASMVPFCELLREPLFESNKSRT